MGKIQVIQIGAGRFGQSWLKVLLGSGQAELAGVVDVVPDNLVAAAAITGLPEDRLFASLESALQAVQADIALIVTPPSTHKALALQALEAGLHVLLEKPVTHTFSEAAELYERSRQYDRKIAVSQNYRWRPCIQTLRKLLQEQAIGRVGYIEYAFRRAHQVAGWRNEMDEVLLEDMSLHHFDLMRFVLNKEPLDVYAQGFRPHWSWFNGNPSASVIIGFEDDVQVNYFGSWVSRGRETTWNGDIRVYGERGMLELSDDRLLLWPEGAEASSEVELPEAAYGDRESSLNDVMEAVRDGREPLTSLADNIKSFALTCAAVESSRAGGRKLAVSELLGVHQG
ncbi:Gfo/Idh/MocA family oxidoreductase [Paenibacillus filicis]|uniref:Gfo/Idh/MocA family oxidoreductase n=1 Tax=Paenibacillus filicis TaxID=669464 RepID=A0ABU9DT71_9BACL